MHRAWWRQTNYTGRSLASISDRTRWLTEIYHQKNVRLTHITNLHDVCGNAVIYPIILAGILVPTHCRLYLPYTSQIMYVFHEAHPRGLSVTKSNACSAIVTIWRGDMDTPSVIMNCESFEFFDPLFAIATIPRWAKRNRGWISSSKGSGRHFYYNKYTWHSQHNIYLHRSIPLHPLYRSCHQFAPKIRERYLKRFVSRLTSTDSSWMAHRWKMTPS
jgi:hypothetical protein